MKRRLFHGASRSCQAHPDADDAAADAAEPGDEVEAGADPDLQGGKRHSE